MRILKFGGKSLSTPEKTQNICKYIKNIYKNDKKIVVVVSAIGKTTDCLIEESTCYGAGKVDSRELDVLLSTGETKSAALFSIMLNSMNIPAKSFQAHQLQISTFGDFQNSKIAYINKQPILDCFEKEQVVIVAGFQGVNKNNETTTLGRGGSDTTAAAIGAVLNKDVEIYSDFDGVFAGDPRLLNFKKLKHINYDSMIQMSKAGSKVIDSKATEIAKQFKFNIISKDSAFPTKKGTIVSDIEKDIISISTIDTLCQISIVFTNTCRLKNIVKNVIYCVNDLYFYNIDIKNNKLTLLVKQEDKLRIINLLSKKLNLVK